MSFNARAIGIRQRAMFATTVVALLAIGVSAWHAGEAALASQEVRAAVRLAIDELPESYRTVLVLRDIEEYPTRDVAALMGVTTNAMKVRLHRARQALVTRLMPILGAQRSANT